MLHAAPVEIKKGQAWSSPRRVQSSGDPFGGTDSKGAITWQPLASSKCIQSPGNPISPAQSSPLQCNSCPREPPRACHSFPLTDLTELTNGPYSPLARASNQPSPPTTTIVRSCMGRSREGLPVATTSTHTPGGPRRDILVSTSTKPTCASTPQPSPLHTQSSNSTSTPWGLLLSPPLLSRPGCYGTTSGNIKSRDTPPAAPRTTNSVLTNVRGVSFGPANAPELHPFINISAF